MSLTSLSARNYALHPCPGAVSRPVPRTRWKGSGTSHGMTFNEEWARKHPSQGPRAVTDADPAQLEEANDESRTCGTRRGARLPPPGPAAKRDREKELKSKRRYPSQMSTRLLVSLFIACVATAGLTFRQIV